MQRLKSPWGFPPLVVVTKKTGGHRFSVDLKPLNNITKVLAYLLPLIGDSFIGKIDLRVGHWQVTFMPFGLSGAPDIFQKPIFMLSGSEDFIMAYIDDIFIF